MCSLFSISLVSQFFLVISLSSSGLRLERMCGQWESFSRESEALSLFISENEKELEALCTSTDPLEKQITTLGVSFSLRL